MNRPNGTRSFPRRSSGARPAPRATPLLLAGALLCLISQIGPAQDAAPAPVRVADIQVRGNDKMSTSAVLERVKSRVGDVYDEAIAQADVQRLLDSGRFTDVKVEKTVGPAGVALTFVVRERATVKKVSIQGNKAFPYAALAGEAKISPGGALERSAVEAGRLAILAKYRAEGYAFAEVAVDWQAFADNQEVVFTVVEGPQVKIRKVVYQGSSFFSDFRLWRETGTQKRLWPFVKGYLDLDQLDRDVTTIRNLYVDEGFLDVEVGRQLDYSDDKKDVRVTFLIREGERYRVNKVIFQGNLVFSDEQIAARLLLKQGAFLTTEALRRDLKQVQDMYGEGGYIYAKADSRKQYLEPGATLPAWAANLPGKPALVNVIIRITEEDRYTVGQSVIRGNSITQARVIRRELRFYPEQVYNTVAVEESRKRLMETRLFEQVTITPSGKAPGVRDALVEVKEGKTAEFIIGVGVSSRDGLLGNISFTQRNFDLWAWPNEKRRLWRGEAWKGAGQTLSVTAEPGLNMSRASIDWFEPYLFDLPYSAGMKAFFFDRPREDYDETRVGGLASLGHTFKNRWYVELAPGVQSVDIHDLDEDAVPEVRKVEGTNLLASLKGTVARNRTDSRWMPTQGDSLRLSYEQVTGDFTFGRATGDYYIYHTIYKDATDRKHVLAGRLTVGSIVGGDAPVFEKFYGGGQDSIRGFRYRGVSPRSAGTDKPIGGDFGFSGRLANRKSQAAQSRRSLKNRATWSCSAISPPYVSNIIT